MFVNRLVNYIIQIIKSSTISKFSEYSEYYEYSESEAKKTTSIITTSSLETDDKKPKIKYRD